MDDVDGVDEKQHGLKPILQKLDSHLRGNDTIQPGVAVLQTKNGGWKPPTLRFYILILSGGFRLR
jgi:hypothetical protein